MNTITITLCYNRDSPKRNEAKISSNDPKTCSIQKNCTLNKVCLTHEHTYTWEVFKFIISTNIYNNITIKLQLCHETITSQRL